MRIAIVILVVLGLLAAVCAAILVKALSLPRVAQMSAIADPEVEIIVAAEAMPAMTVVDGPRVTTRKVARSKMPAGAMTSSTQVVGKVLTRPVVEGQAFDRSCFAQDGQGVYLAAAVPKGKRAVSVKLSEYSGMAGLLYPGSVVDVLVSMNPPGNRGGESMATTLLQGLQVLAIGSQSVTAEQFQDKNPGALSNKGQMNYRMVTFLVDPKQAEILQLAMQFGSIALTMRNPLDTESVPQQMTRLSELSTGEFGRRTTNLLSVAAGLLKAKATSDSAGTRNNPSRTANATPSTARPADKAGDPFAASADEPAPAMWETLIIRGTRTEIRTFPLTDAYRDGLSPDGKRQLEPAPQAIEPTRAPISERPEAHPDPIPTVNADGGESEVQRVRSGT